MFDSKRTKMNRVATLLAVSVLFTSSVGCGGKPNEPPKEATTAPTGGAGGKVNSTRQEISFQIRQYPEDGQPRNHDGAIRVRLDIDRLRAHGLSREDVMKALEESTVVGSPGRADPPPGVVFVTRLYRPDQYENVILKANAEGEIVRLKDVAVVERVDSE